MRALHVSVRAHTLDARVAQVKVAPRLTGPRSHCPVVVQWVKGIMAEGWKPQEPSLIPHIERTKETLATLERAGAEVHVHWVKGHADIAGNETADRLANIVRLCCSVSVWLYVCCHEHGRLILHGNDVPL